MRWFAPLLLVPVLLGSPLSPAMADEVGRVGVDWTGNDIVIEAIPGLSTDFIREHLPGYREMTRVDKNIVLERSA